MEGEEQQPIIHRSVMSGIPRPPLSRRLRGGRKAQDDCQCTTVAIRFRTRRLDLDWDPADEQREHASRMTGLEDTLHSLAS